MKRKRLVIIGLFILMILAPNYAFAQEPSSGFVNEWLENDSSEVEQLESDSSEVEQLESEEFAPVSESGTNSFILLLRVVLALAFILGLIYFLLKFINRNGNLSKQGEALENMGGISLGTNKSIQLIRIGDQLFVVGVGENIELLTEITDEETKQSLVSEKESGQQNSSQVIETLGHKLRGLSPNQSSREKENASDPFSSLFKSELDSMKEKRAQIRENKKEHDSDE